MTCLDCTLQGPTDARNISKERCLSIIQMTHYASWYMPVKRLASISVFSPERCS